MPLILCILKEISLSWLVTCNGYIFWRRSSQFIAIVRRQVRSGEQNQEKPKLGHFFVLDKNAHHILRMFLVYKINEIVRCYVMQENIN